MAQGKIVNCAKCVSSNPTTDKSEGIARASSKASRMTPIAVISFEQITAEGRTEPAASTDMALIPDSIV